MLVQVYVSIVATSIQAANFGGHSGTPAARMKKVPSTVVKNRSRELTTVFESFSPYQGMEGQIVRIWITEIATDGIHLVSQPSYPVWIIIKNMHNLLFASKALVKVFNQIRILYHCLTQISFFSYDRWAIPRDTSKCLWLLRRVFWGPQSIQRSHLLEGGLHLVK